MNKFILSAVVVLFASTSLFAQNRTSKIVLTKGQVIKSTMEMKSSGKMMGGDMTTDMTTQSEITVIDVREDSYKFESSLKKAKMNFKSEMFSEDYDSEDENKKKGMIAQNFEKAIGKKENVVLSNLGKVIPMEDEGGKGNGRGDGKGKGKSKKKKGGGMMRMFGGGGGADQAVSGAFLIIPAEKVEGEKWRVTSEKDGLKTITEYTFNGLMGNLANVSAKQQIKGLVNNNRGGMSMTVNVNRLSTMDLLVDINTGLITLQTIEGNDKSITTMGDKETKGGGKSTITITSEFVE